MIDSFSVHRIYSENLQSADIRGEAERCCRRVGSLFAQDTWGELLLGPLNGKDPNTTETQSECDWNDCAKCTE